LLTAALFLAHLRFISASSAAESCSALAHNQRQLDDSTGVFKSPMPHHSITGSVHALKLLPIHRTLAEQLQPVRS